MIIAAFYTLLRFIHFEICAEVVAPSMDTVRNHDDRRTIIRLVVSKPNKHQPQGFGSCKVDAT